MPSLVTPLARFLPLVLSVSVLASGGCSFMFVDGPPKQHKKLPYFTCTTSRGWPVVDTVFGGLFGLSSIMAFADSSEGKDSAATGAMIGGLAALFVASAVTGYKDAGECREATDDLQQRLIRMHSGPGFAPPSHGPPPTYDPWLRPTDQLFGKKPSPVPPARANDSEGER